MTLREGAHVRLLLTPRSPPEAMSPCHGYHLSMSLSSTQLFCLELSFMQLPVSFTS